MGFGSHPDDARATRVDSNRRGADTAQWSCSRVPFHERLGRNCAGHLGAPKRRATLGLGQCVVAMR